MGTLRATYLSILLLLACNLCSAKGERKSPLLTGGVETSYSLAFLTYQHFNYITTDGDRGDLIETTVSDMHNSEILAHIGLNVTDRFNLSLHCGYAGICSGERMFPLSLRGTWLSGHDPDRNRWLAYGSLGTGFNRLNTLKRPAAELRVGGGYRVHLNRFAKLDFLVSFRETFAHVNIYEMEIGKYVSVEKVRRDISFISAFNFGVALVF